MSFFRSFARRFAPSLFALGILVLCLAGWWHSSRYSERHLHYIGKRSVEVFSASSLIRFSIANGHIGSPGRHTGYRQRNVRGKFVVRPLVPSFRAHTNLWDVTFGYWHFVLLAAVGFGFVLVFDLKRVFCRGEKSREPGR